MFGLPPRKAAVQSLFLTAAPNADASPRAAEQRAKALAADGMHLVHLLGSSLRVDQSLSLAVHFAATHAGGIAGEELERLEWAVRLRHFASIDEGFLAFAEAAGRADGELKRALVTLHGAESEPTREGLERRLDRAYDIVVRAEERRRARLASSLERPLQTLFGVGVVLPLVLASLLPMLQFSGGGMSLPLAGVLLLVAVPGATAAVASRLLKANFLGAGVSPAQERRAFVLTVAPPAAGGLAFALASAAPFLGAPPPVWAALACAATGLAAGTLMHRRSAAEFDGSAMEAELPDFLHAVGTRMAAGRPAEHALMETVEATPANAMAQRLRGVLFDVIVGRRSLAEAIERDEEVREASRVLPALRLLASTADRDTEVAGRVVLHLSEFERLRAEAAASLRTKLKSLVETTHTTTAYFAPLILGITAGMYGLLSRVGGLLVAAPTSGPAPEGFAVIVTLYLALEIGVAGWFSARLQSPRPLARFARTIARDLPIAMGLFTAAYLGSAGLF